MPFVIYNMKLEQYRSRAGRDEWDVLNEAAIFQQRKNAVKFVKDRLEVWTRYVESWTGQESQTIAFKLKDDWSHTEVREVEFRLK